MAMLEVQIDLSSSPFSLDFSLDSGQVFRWSKTDGWWRGVVSNQVVMVQQHGDKLTARSYGHSDADVELLRGYFRLDEELDSILQSVNRDPVIDATIRRFYGLRLIRQDPWECLVSFICATNTNIPAIRRMLESLSRRFGVRIDLTEEFYSFPDPEKLAKADLHLLRLCGLGYRAEFVREVAVKVASGQVDLTELQARSYDEAKRLLVSSESGRKTYLGVGPKVSDCVLLFSLDKLEAFPIDVWMRRCVVQSYSSLLGKELERRLLSRESSGDNLSLAEYEATSKVMRSYFGKFAGYAQEYLYRNIRSGVKPLSRAVNSYPRTPSKPPHSP